MLMAVSRNSYWHYSFMTKSSEASAGKRGEVCWSIQHGKIWQHRQITSVDREEQMPLLPGHIDRISAPLEPFKLYTGPECCSQLPSTQPRGRSATQRPAPQRTPGRDMGDRIRLWGALISETIKAKFKRRVQIK